MYQLLSSSLEAVGSRIQYQTVIRDFQGSHGILLHHYDGGSCVVDLLDSLEDRINYICL